MRSCPMGRQTRSSGEPSRADVNRGQTMLWHAGDRQHTQSIPINVKKHLQQLDYVNLFDVWVPRKSSWVVGVPSD